LKPSAFQWLSTPKRGWQRLLANAVGLLKIGRRLLEVHDHVFLSVP
jgi:hypothetical protein